MRCDKCNVDLGEYYTKCPLCGANAVDDEPLLKGVLTAEYPTYDDETLLNEKFHRKLSYPAKYVFWLGLMAEIVISAAAAISGKAILWYFAVPFLLEVVATVYLILGIREKKGTLLHGACYLLAQVAVMAIFLLVSIILKFGIFMFLSAFLVGASAFFLLYVLRSDRVKNQIAALFNLK